MTFQVRHPLSIVTVIARAGQGGAVAEKLSLHGPMGGTDQYFVLAEAHGEGALYRHLKTLLAGIASVTDQSHGRVVIRIAGPRRAPVLAKGTPVDLHQIISRWASRP